MVGRYKFKPRLGGRRACKGSTFLPNVPVLPGAVLNGLGGDTGDQADIGNGDWQISGYWTPMVAYTLWLMAELSEYH